MTLPSEFKVSLVSLMMLGITGCSTADGVNFQQTAQTSRAEYQTWSYQQTDAARASQLTDLVAIPALTQMVNDAISRNPSLQQTALALQIAYAQENLAVGDQLPELSAGFSGKREENNGISYTTDLTVSWELDLWQKISDSVNAAQMDVATSQATYQAAQDALVANIMRAWLQINLRQQLLAIESERLTVLENNETFILERYRVGLGQLEELDNARSSSAQTKATLAEYQELLAKEYRTLKQLLGRNPESFLSNIEQHFPEVLEPLATLPEQDLGRRPDLQGAYYTILAEQYRTSVAYKALLPSINLSASLTDIGSSPSDALLTSPAWGLLGQLTAPLFQGGKLRAQVDIAELTAEQSYWAYQETLLNAVTEVENTLGQEQSLERRQQYLGEALGSASRSVANYQTKYRQGLVDILDLLSVQQQTFDLQSQLVQVTYNRLVNRIDLGLALGLGVSS
ncbi:TolC family protein [Photobacterium chitinilyticum]|uniref:TolC family protein n=1 Tax=Photobacterium chitinilyticum TaxID=2485123 RepID=UPI003D127BE4